MYETELMREILKSPMAQKMIQEISPRYGNAYAFLWLMQVIGIEWDAIGKWVEEYRLQVVPQTATWSLKYWEKQYGIETNEALPDERRRAAIVAKRISKGPMNPARLEKIASAAAGFPVRVVENTAKNRFEVYVSAAPWLVDEDAVIAAIEHAKPARLRYDLLYEQATTGYLYMGGAIFQKKKTTLTQLG